MKRLYSQAIYTPAALIIFFAHSLLAQPSMELESFSIQVPLMEHDGYSSNVPGAEYSRSDDMEMKFLLDRSYQIPLEPINHGDTLIFTFYNSGQMGAESRKYILRFIFDSVKKNLKIFSISYTFDTSFMDQLHRSTKVRDVGFIVFQSIDYVQFNDSILIVNETGKACEKMFDSAGYTYAASTITGNGYTTGEYHSTDSFIRFDSGAYVCSLSFIHRGFFNSANETSTRLRTLSISTSIPNHTIHFSLPLTTHPQPLRIYDILGREISRIEIPAGNSSYQISSVGYPKGTYFARLGLQTASFIVN